MSSEIQNAHILADQNRIKTSYLVGEASNEANLNFSVAKVTSVYPDRSSCDLLLANGTFRTNIPSTIQAELLNITGHLVDGDFVLISHKGTGRECRIILKLQDANKTVSEDESFKKHTRVSLGVLAA